MNHSRRDALLVLAAGLLAAKRIGAATPTRAPDVQVMAGPGEPVALPALRGQVLLVNFWATSCTICIAEMPELARLHNRYAARGLRTFAVAMRHDRPDYVLGYLERNPLPFPITLDVDGAVAEGFGGVRATPTSFLIDPQGAIVARYAGAFDFADLKRRLERLLPR